jgi:hypothetical protein
MDVRFVDGHPNDERVAAVVTLAIEAYLDAETRQTTKSMTRITPWVTAGRLEARGLLPLSSTRRKRGWGAHG